MKSVKCLFVTIALLLLSGCVFHQPIQQGNIITPAKAQAIQPGMTTQAVVAELGSPVLKNAYADGRAVYVYTSEPSRHHIIVKRLEIVFRHNRVVNVRTGL